MSGDSNGLIRAGVCFHRRPAHRAYVDDFLGDGEPARSIGTILFDLRAPPFWRKTTDRGTNHGLTNSNLGRVKYLAPSKATLCCLVLPNREAIEGALEEHRQEQRLDAPGWAGLLEALHERHALWGARRRPKR